jgi:hypothetical protein
MYQGWSRSSYLQVTYYLLLLLNGVHEQTSGAERWETEAKVLDGVSLDHVKLGIS